MHYQPAALLRLLLPVLFIAAAMVLRPMIGQWSAEARVLVGLVPYALCALASFLAFQFNRLRLLLAALGVAAMFWMLRNNLQVSLSQPEAARVYLAVSLALPLLGLYLLVLPRTDVRTLRGLAALAVFVMLGLVSYWLAGWLPQSGAAALQYYAAWPAEGYVLSWGATALLVLVLVAVIGMLVLGSDETVAALFGVLLSLGLALAQLHLQDISLAACTAAGLCLTWGAIRSSHAMAYRDDLTGLPGRRALNERLARLGRQYCIAMLDVDHFKRCNDTYGHDVGDEVLRMVASKIARVGEGGTAYRYGGEEFCVVFPRRGLEECTAELERMREQVAGYVMSLRDRALRPQRNRDGARRRGATRLGGSTVSVTISAGLAARSDDCPDPESVIKAADGNLYRAKSKGRNRVVC